VGGKVSERWQNYASLSHTELAELVAPHTKAIVSWFVGHIGSVAGVLFQFLLTVIVAAVMYATGEQAAAGILAFMRRLAGARGEVVTILAEKSIRSVALGIVVTATIQTVLSGVGLALMGVPGTALWTVAILVLCLIQIGPLPVLLPVVIWLYGKGDPIRGTLMLVISIVALTVDNFVRPVLIKKGADLPLVLVFTGVIGGLVAFGVVGLFIGPVVLAVTYTLLESWVTETGLAQESDA
jgi:predicted PurR-regulated permease PerM